MIRISTRIQTKLSNISSLCPLAKNLLSTLSPSFYHFTRAGRWRRKRREGKWLQASLLPFAILSLSFNFSPFVSLFIYLSLPLSLSLFLSFYRFSLLLLFLFLYVFLTLSLSLFPSFSFSLSLFLSIYISLALPLALFCFLSLSVSTLPFNVYLFPSSFSHYLSFLHLFAFFALSI